MSLHQLRHRRPYAGGGAARSGVSAPTTAWPVGTVVGVPTGTSLTATTGLPAADLTADYTLRHPVTGQTATRPACPTWVGRSWSAVLELGGGLGPTAGNTYVFRNCLFSSVADFRALEVLDANATPGQMAPLVILERCTITGNDVLARALVAGAVWLDRCHVTGGEDAWGGAYWSVAIQSNFIATTDGSPVDPHQDGVQLAGVGVFTGYQCWFDAGPDPIANSAFRAGTDFSAIAGLGLYYSTFNRGGYNVQLRGDPGARGITGVTVRGCRWVPGAGFGPVDSVDTTYTEWTDNRFLGGAAIPQPA